MAKSKGKAGGIPRPTLDKPKNMPGAMPSPAISSMFGGKSKMGKQGGESVGKKLMGGKGGESHGMHGAPKAPKPKMKKK